MFGEHLDTNMGRVDKLTFDVAISLGGCCQTAYQLARNNYRGPAYPFDWITTTVPAIHKMLETDFVGWMEKDSFTLHGDHALDNMYGCKFLHDFRLAPETFLNDFQIIYDRYQRRIERLRRLFESRERVLLIRREGGKEETDSLRLLIKSLYPRLKFKLAVLNEEPWEGSYMLRQTKPWRWRGDDNEWKRFFDKFIIHKKEVI